MVQRGRESHRRLPSRDNPSCTSSSWCPSYPDHEAASTETPGRFGRQDAVSMCAAAGGERFAVYDIENPQGVPVYVHAKVVVVDDVWAMVGSDNLNRRSWTHDSELSVSVLDSVRDDREPTDPAGTGDGARRFARDLRLGLWREHLDRKTGDLGDLAICSTRTRRSRPSRRRRGRSNSGTTAVRSAPGPRAVCCRTGRRPWPVVTGSGPRRSIGPCTTRMGGLGAPAWAGAPGAVWQGRPNRAAEYPAPRRHPDPGLKT